MLLLKSVAQIEDCTQIYQMMNDHRVQYLKEQKAHSEYWEFIASFIKKQCLAFTLSISNLMKQHQYLIQQLNHLSCTLDEINENSKRASFQTNWFLLCSFSTVFTVKSELSILQNADFVYFKQKKVLKDIHFLLQRSLLFSADFSLSDLEKEINHLEFLLQNLKTESTEDTSETESTESTLLRLTTHQSTKHLSSDSQRSVTLKWQNISNEQDDWKMIELWYDLIVHYQQDNLQIERSLLDENSSGFSLVSHFSLINAVFSTLDLFLSFIHDILFS